MKTIDIKQVYPTMKSWRIDCKTNVAILVEEQDIHYFFTKIIEAKNEVKVSMSGYDFQENETVDENLEFLDVDINVLTDVQDLDIDQKFSELTAVEQTMMRLLAQTEDKKILVIQHPFTDTMSLQNKMRIIEIMRKLQEEKNCVILSVISNPKDGLFFKQLAVFRKVYDDFLPVKGEV